VKITVSRESVFWGCPRLSFKANLPFNGMRPAYAAFEKEIPMTLQSTVGFFKELKCYAPVMSAKYFRDIRLFP
jgi:hypothetical protein